MPGARTAVLLEESFAEFPLGKFPHNYGPWGEYHHVPRWEPVESEGDHGVTS